MNGATIIDLSMPIEEHWRFPTQFEDVWTPRPQFTFHTTKFTMGSHGFTHVDAPSHTDREGTTIDALDLERFMGPAILVDVSDLGDNRPITADVLRPRCGDVRRGDILLLRSDQGMRHPTTTKEFWTLSPWITVDAAKFLLTLGISAVAFDFPQDRSIRAAYDPDHVPNPDPDEDEACHVHLLPAGVLQFEYLTNFGAISAPRFAFVGLPLKFTRGDGSPIRAIAIEGTTDV